MNNLFTKNRNREAPTFANINLLGACNVDCFFCLGKDIAEELGANHQLQLHYSQWKNFLKFLKRCEQEDIKKIYITGQNTDSLLYKYLAELIGYLHDNGFKVGLRTNGYMAVGMMDTINLCELSVGYSIHSLNPMVNKMICGRATLPQWNKILTQTNHPRVQIVVNRCNVNEFFDILKFTAQFKNIRYIQARRISTDRRQVELQPDMIAYEQLYAQVKNIFPVKMTLWEDCEVFEIYEQDVCFWRTVKTSVNSFNYFTDGTVSEEYFVVEGYLKNYEISRSL